MTAWGWRERPADPEELAAAEDRAYADLRGPDEFPDRPGQQYRMAQARAPEPGQALQRPLLFISEHLATRLRDMPDGHLVDELVDSGDLVIQQDDERDDGWHRTR